MKPEDAILCLQESTTCCLKAARQCAIEALKKQIPTKPIIRSWETAKCPSCGAELGEDLEDGYVKNWEDRKVCDCGQLLKWRDEEEE